MELQSIYRRHFWWLQHQKKKNKHPKMIANTKHQILIMILVFN